MLSGAGLEELSREDLLALFSAQARMIETLTAAVATLTARVSVLEAQNAELKLVSSAGNS
jgi:cell division protein FtsB